LNRNDCLFCEIIEENSKGVIVYQDDLFLVLMDKYPINPGHILVMPKDHYNNLFDMDSKFVGKLFQLVWFVADAVRIACKADGINIGQNNGKAANQMVNHVHVHIIPRYIGDVKTGNFPSRRIDSVKDLEKISSSIKNVLKNPII